MKFPMFFLSLVTFFLIISVEPSLSANDCRGCFPRDFPKFIEIPAEHPMEIHRDKNVIHSQIDYGAHQYKNQRFLDLTIYGPATIENTVVCRQLRIYGPLKASQLSTKNIIVHGSINATHFKSWNTTIIGPALFKDSMVESYLSVVGDLTAHNTIFKDQMNVSAKTITLINSRMEDIVVRKGSDYFNTPQKIVLTGNSIVNKDIVFEQGEGIVEMTKDTSLIGELIGGSIVKVGEW